MRLVKAMLTGIGSIALIALMVTLAAPKAARGVAAVLVQAVNTAAAPAITQGVADLASQMVTVACFAGTCRAVAPGGAVTFSAYSVPVGQNLVIKQVEITGGSTGGGIASFFLLTTAVGGLIAPPGWRVANDLITHEFSIPSGIVWPGGAALAPDPSATTPGVQAVIHGYLTAN